MAVRSVLPIPLHFLLPASRCSAVNPAQPIRQTRSAQIMYHIGAVLQRSILLFPLGFVAMCAAAAVNFLTGSIDPCGTRGNALIVLLYPALPAFGLDGLLDIDGIGIIIAAALIGGYDYALLFSIGRELPVSLRARMHR